MVRAKFFLHKQENLAAPENYTSRFFVGMKPEAEGEDGIFGKASPNAEACLHVLAGEATAFLALGGKFYFDFYAEGEAFEGVPAPALHFSAYCERKTLNRDGSAEVLIWPHHQQDEALKAIFGDYTRADVRIRIVPKHVHDRFEPNGNYLVVVHPAEG